MKYTLFLLLFSFGLAGAQTPVFNEYGEVQTQITRTSAIQAWTGKDLEAEKTKLAAKLGEGMYNDIYAHSNLNQYPPAINEPKKYWANEQKITEYKVWFVADMKESYACILRVSPKDNRHMPPGFLPADGSDFYFLVEHFGIENYSSCSQNRKNTPDSYKTYLENQKYDPFTPGLDEFDKGLAALKKSDYQTALDFFTRSAEMGNDAAMYNLGYMYYNNKLPQKEGGYSSAEVLNSVLNGSREREERMQKAFSWYKKAAEAGHTKSMYALGVLYSNGDGVAADKTEAKKWFQKAADRGNTEAKEELEKLQ